MAESLAPTDADGLADAVRWAVAGEHPLEVLAGGSKQTLGRPVQSAATVSLAAFDGIVDYQPSELVLTAQAATPLATIEAALEAERQMLAFEPADYGPLLRASGGADLSAPGGATSARLAARLSAAHWPATSQARAGSRRAPRAITSSACMR